MHEINREIKYELKRSQSAQMLNYEDYLVRTKHLLTRERYLVNMKSFLLNERLEELQNQANEKKVCFNFFKHKIHNQPNRVRTSVLIRNLSGNVSNKEIAAFLTTNKTYSYEHISLSKTNKTAMVNQI